MSLLLSKGGIILGLIVVGLIALAVIFRNAPWHKPPVRQYAYEVVEAINGASLRVRVNRRRLAIIIVPGIAAPAEGEPLFEESRKNLGQIAGKRVFANVEQRRLFRDKKVVAGTIRGEAGTRLDLEQVARGMAKALPDAPKDVRKAEVVAKGKKLGVWQ